MYRDNGIPTQEEIEHLRKTYLPGTRIVLIEMKKEPQMYSGLEGTVQRIDGIGQIQMHWDNGSTLALNVREDLFHTK